MKVDIDKFIASLCKNKIDYGLRAVINEALDEQNLRFDGNDLVEIKLEPTFKIEAGKCYMCIKDYITEFNSFYKGHIYFSYEDNVLNAKEENGRVLFVREVSEYFRPATEEEIVANNLSIIGSAEIDPDIQEIINDHFDEMFDDEPKPKFKVGQTIKKEGFCSGFIISKIENGFYYNPMGGNFPVSAQDQWELVEPQSNAINILPNGIDIDSMMPNFEDRDWVVGFHTKISDVAKEFYRKGLEDMLQAIRKKG